MTTPISERRNRLPAAMTKNIGRFPPGFFRGVLALFGAGILTAIIYLILRLIFVGSIENALGSTLVFSGFAAAFGFVWGVGGWSPGANDHEGPVAYAAEHPDTSPTVPMTILDRTRKFVRWLTPQVIPLLRPLGIALAVVLVITGIVLFVAANPIVPAGRRQTAQSAADAALITGDKLLPFVIFIGVVVVSLAGFAITLAILFSYLNRQVEISHKVKTTPLPSDSPLMKVWRGIRGITAFFLEWVADIFEGLSKSVTR